MQGNKSSRTQRLCLYTAALGSLLGAGATAYAVPIEGSTSGVFADPAGPSGMVTTGVGTANFTWGEATSQAGPSWLKYSGETFSTTTETDFLAGHLEYFNGPITSGTGADSVKLNITMNLTTPSGVHPFSFDLNLINTPNVGTPEQQADYVTLPPFPGSTFNVDGVDYTLKLTFGNNTPGGFVEQNQFHVLEGGSASAELVGNITANFPPPDTEPNEPPSGTVPEAGSTLALLAFACLSVDGLRRKLKQ